jgi:hypothetical protein
MEEEGIILKTTSEKSKIYLTYLDDQDNKTTLSFRDESSMNKHIVQNKIFKNGITISTTKPNTYGFTSVGSINSSFVSYRHTTKRGLGNG